VFKLAVGQKFRLWDGDVIEVLGFIGDRVKVKLGDGKLIPWEDRKNDSWRLASANALGIRSRCGTMRVTQWEWASLPREDCDEPTMQKGYLQHM
jgi:hypothetical protein